MTKKLAVILPAYNEEEVIEKTTSVLEGVLHDLNDEGLISVDSFLMYVDDGSKDQTWSMINDLAAQYGNIRGLRFSHNFGHQNALVAGLHAVTGTDVDYAVTIDADLQDDPKAIFEMVRLASEEGKNVVYGVRNDRTSDTVFKRGTAQFFYKLMNWLGVKTIPNHADFRLVDQSVLAAFAEYGEREMFLRGIFPSIGFNAAEVYYARAEREAGETKYPLKKMLDFAMNGITSFSIAPITFVRNLGVLMFGVSVLLFFYVIVGYFIHNAAIGWPSLIASIWLLGGLQLIAIGMIGEYIGKIFVEVKHRPRYIIQDSIGGDKQ
jgi:glycosyltransferase involved in cell wall biosynthesis